jgi:hypothetical protein
MKQDIRAESVLEAKNEEMSFKEERLSLIGRQISTAPASSPNQSIRRDQQTTFHPSSFYDSKKSGTCSLFAK